MAFKQRSSGLTFKEIGSSPAKQSIDPPIAEAVSTRVVPPVKPVIIEEKPIGVELPFGKLKRTSKKLKRRKKTLLEKRQEKKDFQKRFRKL